MACLENSEPHCHRESAGYHSKPSGKYMIYFNKATFKIMVEMTVSFTKRC